MTEWQPIESAPRDRFILLYTPAHDEMVGFVAMAKWQGGSWYGVDEDGLTFNPLQAWDRTTHWMPLPSPPSEAASPLGGPILTREDQESVSSNATLPRTLPGAHTNAEPAAEGEP